MLLLGMGLILWLAVSAVVVSLCMAAARGDRGLAALNEAAVPSETAPTLTEAPGASQHRVAS